MKIDVDYYYTQKFLPTKRHKKIRKRQIKDSIPVSIAELTADVFPVAFIVHDMKSVQENMTSYEDYRSDKCDFRMFSEEIRTYKGKLYKPVRITHGAAISTVFEDKSYVIHNLEWMARRDWSVDDGDEFSENSVIKNENKKEVRQMLRNAAKHYIYFDGKFWTVCGEPRYNITTFGFGHNHGGTGFFIVYGYNHNIPNDNYFSALQREEAVAYGKAVALARGDTESIDGMGDDRVIDVLMPEIVKVNPKRQCGTGSEFMNTMENVIKNSDSQAEAGIMCIALAMAGM